MSGLINTVGTKAIGAMSTFNLWWTLGGTFVLVITLLVKAPEKVNHYPCPHCVELSHLDIEYSRVCFHRLRKVRDFCGDHVHAENLPMDSFTGWSSRGFVVLLGFLQVFPGTGLSFIVTVLT